MNGARFARKNAESGSLPPRMDPSQIDALVQRLVANPHDEEALAYAHQAGGRGSEVVRAAPGARRRRDARPRLRLALAERSGERVVHDPRRRAPRGARAHAGDRPRSHAADGVRPAGAALSRQGGREGAGRAARAAGEGPRAARPAERRDPRASSRRCTRSSGACGARACSSRRRPLENFRRSIDLEPGERVRHLRRARDLQVARPVGRRRADVRGGALDRARSAASARAPARRGGDASGRGRPAGRDAGAGAGAADRRPGRVAPAGVRVAHRRAPRRRRGRAGAGAHRRRRAARRPRRGLRRRARARLLGGRARHPARATIAPCSSTPTTRGRSSARTTCPRATSRTSRRTRTAPWPPRRAGCSRRATRRRGSSTTRSRSSSRCAGSATPRRPRSSASCTRRSGSRCPRCRRPCPSRSSASRSAHGGQAASGRTARPRRSAARGDRRPGCRERPALPADKLQGVLDAAQMLANKGKRAEAYTKYREVLEADPAHPEALSWVEDYLRTKRDYASLRDVLLAATARSRRVDRGPQGAPARGRGAVRGQPPRHRRRHQRLEAAPGHRPRRRRRAPVAHPPAREDPALGRPGEPARAGGDGRGRPREEDRPREEARDAAGAEAPRLRGRGRGVGAHREPHAGGRPGGRHGVQDVREGGRDRPRRPGDRRERRRRSPTRRRAAPCSSDSASFASSSTIRRPPARPTPTRPRRRRASSCGRRRSAASSPPSGGTAPRRPRRSARTWLRDAEAAGAALRARRPSTSDARATTTARSQNLERAADLDPDERGVRAPAGRPVHVGAEVDGARRSSSSGAAIGSPTRRSAWRCAVRRPASTRRSSATRRPRARPGSRSSRTATTRKRSSGSSTTRSSARITPRRRRCCVAWATPRSIAPSRRASRCARPSCSPRAWATSTGDRHATSASSPISTPPAALPSRPSPTCRRRATTRRRRPTPSSAS